jgi:hypothetical protein
VTKLTKNDQRVLDAVAQASGRWDGFMPHGSADHLAIRRLLKFNLVSYYDEGMCETCSSSHEGPIFKPTEVNE